MLFTKDPHNTSKYVFKLTTTFQLCWFHFLIPLYVRMVYITLGQFCSTNQHSCFPTTDTQSLLFGYLVDTHPCTRTPTTIDCFVLTFPTYNQCFLLWFVTNHTHFKASPQGKYLILLQDKHPYHQYHALVSSSSPNWHILLRYTFVY
jgi:hypothetical protein